MKSTGSCPIIISLKAQIFTWTRQFDFSLQLQLRDCAIIIWRGRGVLRLIGGPELKPKRRVGGGGGKMQFRKHLLGG